mgnify:CR=1 FL=1
MDEWDELVLELLKVVKANEWQRRHAAENTYCPFCSTDDDLWRDQKKHHPGCKYVILVTWAHAVIDGKEK